MADFAPWWALRNRHLQSVLPSLPWQRRRTARRAAGLLAASRELLLDCGGGVRLQAFQAEPQAQETADTTLAVLLHGWEGSATAPYVLSLGQDLFNAGMGVIRLNLRDHGDTHHLNRGIFHSCLLPEVVSAVSELRRLNPGRPLWLIGFSLGGNFMLRVASSPGADALRLAGVIAISPVLDPASTLHALERGLPLYRRYFVWKWSRSLARKQALWPQDHNFSSLLRVADLRRMTAELVARYTDFPHIDDYLNGYAITGERLATLQAPAVIVTSRDDPIIPVGDLQRLAAHPRLEVLITEHGGHTGFVERLGAPSWVNDFIRRRLSP
ncbi:MAG TPA: alpha/beta fold hydrolase [Steroidobacteraceae bacterium]|nr:alpha/beta fold hydrolase [Steroidobacteraceae bacterium]